jgi:hypothetical protein
VRGTIAEGGVWPAGVVRNPSSVDDDLGFAQRVEDFAVQTVVAQLAVAFAVAILPGAPGSM